MERILQPQDTVLNNETIYVVTSVKGRGANCVVYSTLVNGREHLLKEYNPIWADLERDKTGALRLRSTPRSGKRTFASGLEAFKEATFMQEKIRDSISGLRNVTTNIQNTFEANGTFYVDMTVFDGESYDQIKEASLYDLVERVLAITRTIGNYHAAGYLHLDIKPENIFALPETKQMVMLFDFDSVIKKDALSTSSISYSRDWAAPELKGTYKISSICEATDVFSIGEILFFKIFGRHSRLCEQRSFSHYEFNQEIPILEDVNPSVLPLLTNIFRHTICSNVASRYQNTKELEQSLKKLLTLANPEEPYLLQPSIAPTVFFIGRETELDEIKDSLKIKPVVILTGMGGIGKSEIARKYVLTYKGLYDNIVFTMVNDSLVTAITDDQSISIAHVCRDIYENTENYFQRKLRVLKKICTERTLFVIDNLDDPVRDTETLRMLLTLPCRFLITSRSGHWNYPCIQVSRISSQDELFKLFCYWYGETPTDQAERNAILEIVEHVNGHTLTLELIAKQAVENFNLPSEKLHFIKANGILRDEIAISNHKNNMLIIEPIMNHLRILFNIGNLSDVQVTTLLSLSMMPANGLSGREVVQFLGRAKEISYLVSNGWVERTRDHILRIHPLIADFIQQTTAENNYQIDEQINLFTKVLDNSWGNTSVNELCIIDTVAVRISAWLMKKESYSSAEYEFFINEYWIDSFRQNFGVYEERLNIILATLKQDHASQKLLFKATRARFYLAYHQDDVATCEDLIKEADLLSSANTDPKDLADYEAMQGLICNLRSDYQAEAQHYLAGIRYCELINEPIGVKRKFLLLLNLVGTYLDSEAFSNALDAALKAKNLAQNNPSILKKSDLADAYQNLGEYYRETGEYYSAEQHYTKALALREDLYGANSIQVALSVFGLSRLYLSQEKLGISLEYAQKALKMYSEFYPENSTELIRVHNLLGEIYSGLGNKGASLNEYLKTVEMVRTLGLVNVDYLISLCNLCGSEIKNNNYLEAEKYYEEVVSTCTEILGDMNNIYGATLSQLNGEILIHKGDYTAARKALIFARDYFATLQGAKYRKEIERINKQILTLSSRNQ